MQRVAITGVGLVTPLGLTAAENVARSRLAESGIGPARAFAVDGHPAQALATVAGFELEPFLRFPKNYKFMGRAVQFAVRAAREAVDQSGIDPRKMDASRVGIHVGSGQTGVEYDHFFPSLIMAWDAGREMDYKYLGGLPSHLIDRYICRRTLASGGLALLSTEFGIRGPNGNFTQKDTASAQALHAAYLDLLEERCDVAVAGGYDSLATTGNFLAYEQAGLLIRQKVSGGGQRIVAARDRHVAALFEQVQVGRVQSLSRRRILLGEVAVGTAYAEFGGQ